MPDQTEDVDAFHPGIMVAYSAPNNPGRRRFLLSTAAASAVLAASPVLAPMSAFAAAQPDNHTFGQVSRFVTGRKTLPDVLVTRAHDQLLALDPAFDDKLAALASTIQASGAKSIDAFLKTNPDSALRDTMVTITGAFYLGYTGTPDPSQMTDNARFVTYHEALMFEPTADATPIPTYSHHGHNYWAKPPATIATD